MFLVEVRFGVGPKHCLPWLQLSPESRGKQGQLGVPGGDGGTGQTEGGTRHCRDTSGQSRLAHYLRQYPL